MTKPMTLQDTIKRLEGLLPHARDRNKNLKEEKVQKNYLIGYHAGWIEAVESEALPALRTAQAEIDRLKEALVGAADALELEEPSDQAPYKTIVEYEAKIAYAAGRARAALSTKGEG